jgi:methionine-rich copper-binding protein CopC
MPRIISGCAAVLAAAVVIASTPPGAAAHALLLESTPAPGATLTEPPAQLYLRFNSKLEKRLSHVTLSTDKGRPVALPISVNAREKPDRLMLPLGPLVPGAYLVRYKVLAVDGHITEGILRFSVVGPK